MEAGANRTLTPNMVDGKYRIIKRLAIGGMAEIFLAEALNIHGFRKKVVLKRILPQYANEKTYVDMFLDEAKLVAQMNHSSIVQVFDIGQDNEGVFFAMEYVDGIDLSDVLGTCFEIGKKLSIAEVLAIVIPAAEGLHHAHELRSDEGQFLNVIHRDVSPSNIIVTKEGRVKLLDFGVAKSSSQSRETTGISLKGKFGYMAPEQCDGLTLDRRCDIFSFGVVLWELITGRRLFSGGNEPSVLMRIMGEDAQPPSTVIPDLPPRLDAICLKALARDRELRYQSLHEFLSDIDDFMVESGIVINSRTLSRLLSDTFAHVKDTLEIQKIQKPAVYASQVFSAPAPAVAPFWGEHSGTGGFATMSSSGQYEMEQEPSAVQEEAQGKKWLIVVALAAICLLLFIVVRLSSKNFSTTKSPELSKPKMAVPAALPDNKSIPDKAAPAALSGGMDTPDMDDQEMDTPDMDTPALNDVAKILQADSKPRPELSPAEELESEKKTADKGKSNASPITDKIQTKDETQEEPAAAPITKDGSRAKSQLRSVRDKKHRGSFKKRNKKPKIRKENKKSDKESVKKKEPLKAWDSNSPFAPE